jgi:predicted Holliday junction resolvase-like endonuclease
MDRETKICAIVLAFVLLLILVIVSHLKNQDYQIKITQLETELVVRKELLEREIKELKEVQKILIEENRELKEKLKRYETLSNYMEERLKTSNPDLYVDKIIYHNDKDW